MFAKGYSKAQWCQTVGPKLLLYAYTLSRRLVLWANSGSVSIKAAFLRSIGLWVFLLGLFQGEEEPKPLVSHSRILALARCGVHILPAAVSITVLLFNVQGYFIGAQLEGQQDMDSVKLAVLQVCAKAQVTKTPIHLTWRSWLIKQGIGIINHSQHYNHSTACYS